MKTKKKAPLKRTSRRKKSVTGLPTDARELDSFIATLDASGNLAWLLKKPLKKSA